MLRKLKVIYTEKIILKKFSIRNMESSKNKEATRTIIEEQIVYDCELEHGMNPNNFILEANSLLKLSDPQSM